MSGSGASDQEDQAEADEFTVFNLPHNPITLTSFKYRFIKSRVEKSRAQTVDLKNQTESMNGKRQNNKGFSAARSDYLRHKATVKRHL
jgi:hypothetical protein